MRGFLTPKLVLQVVLVCAFVATTAGFTYIGCDNNTSEPSYDRVVDDGGAEIAGVGGQPGGSYRGCKGRYRKLQNIRHEAITWPKNALENHVVRLYDAGSEHAWCWYWHPHPRAGQIYWRQSNSAWTAHQPIMSAPTNRWYSSDCANPPTTCLYRHETQAQAGGSISFAGITIPIGINEWLCAGTRINGDGSHSRRLHKGYRCRDVAAMSAGQAEGTVTTARLSKSIGLNEVGTKALQAKVYEDCKSVFETGKFSRRCKLTMKRAYSRLSAADRALLRRKGIR